MNEFVAAVTECHRIQSEQLAAIRRGEVFPFEDALAKVWDRRLNAKYALMAHQEQHGC